MRTRLAPTPSGFLHIGNVRNFRIVAEVAGEVGAELALRIDDVDSARYRRAYTEDIFRVLRVMGLDWSVGPRDADDFEAGWSQRRRTEDYRAALSHPGLAGSTYACTCSRAVLTGPATGGCPGGCRHADQPLSKDVSALRLHIPIGTAVAVDGHVVDLPTTVGDPVLWRRDDVPAFHLVSVLEDAHLAITHIVRGRDLVPASALHIHLAERLGLSSVAAATYLHHDLVTGADGTKLSKSTLRSGSPLSAAEITSA